MKKLFVFTLAAAVAVIMVVPGTWAQNPDTDEFTLEQIMVTAERREVNVQSVAASLQALPGDDLVMQGKATAAQMLESVPNVVYGEGGRNGSPNDKAQAQPVEVAKPEPAPEPAPPPEKKAEPVAAAPAAKDPVNLQSDPKGASLYKGAALIGKLPSKLTRPESGAEPVHYTLKLKGYKDLDVAIVAETPTDFTVTLDKLAAAAPRKKVVVTSGGGGAKPKPAAKDKSELRITKKKKSRIGGDLADPWAN